MPKLSLLSSVFFPGSTPESSPILSNLFTSSEFPSYAHRNNFHYHLHIFLSGHLSEARCTHTLGRAEVSNYRKYGGVEKWRREYDWLTGKSGFP
ncbi:hypothetical protein BDZ45DRAFT_742041 [Acephala macrosclerotiorum]|nr:hypothetical protein BDZ45DRAFT_742041 [Acephala macrosclerotiorum]